MSINVIICPDAVALGKRAAEYVAYALREAVSHQGRARLLVSTGASQFTLFDALVLQDVPWEHVEMFHLDEYIDMPETHPASFIRYLKERFTSKVSLGAVHFVNGREDITGCIQKLTDAIRKEPVDVGLIGIGENAHIAFNDPPANFEDTAAYSVVQLDEACRRQQFGEGWFPSIEDVPRQAISMTVYQILQCKKIICAVPYQVKAQAIFDTLHAPEVTNMIPATKLRCHPDVTLYLDGDSSSLLDKK